MNRRKFLKNTAGLALTAAFTAHGTQASAAQITDERLRRMLDSARTSVAGIPLRHQDKLRKIYANRRYVPLWTRQGQITQTARAVIHKLENSPLLGLHKASYYPKVLNSWVHFQDANSTLQLELVLTDSLYEFFDNLANGQTSKAPGNPGTWHQKHGRTNIEYEALQFFSGDATFNETVDRLQPINYRYTDLLLALRDHHRIYAQGGYTRIAPGNTLKVGSRSSRISQLRNRLLQSGDLTNTSSPTADIFDWEVEQGVKNFQQRHGLQADGIPGNKTLAELNIPIEKRIAQIEINLDRWRWLPRDLGANNVIVNTAGFDMKVTLQYNDALDMKVVVGKPENQTPIFSDEMEHMVFKPSWNVPKSISREELLPKELSSPGYLDNRNFVVVSRSDQTARPVSSLPTYELDPSTFNAKYRLRQQPGKKNALGEIKFMFPNRHSIYLHDTNAKHLFAENKRAFSHGCIRVENPELLARTLLLNDGKGDYAIDELINNNNSKAVKLGENLPVHITYQTSWVDEHGRVQFRPDIYGHDQHALHNYQNSRPRQISQETYALAQLGISSASAEL